MRLLSKIGLLLIIVSMGVISVEAPTYFAALIMFFGGGILYLLFDSEEK